MFTRVMTGTLLMTVLLSLGTTSHARNYDPESGRFISRDPMGQPNPDGPGLYGYTSSDPANRVDPMGLWSWPWWGGIKYPDMSAFPDDPRNGSMTFDDGSIVTGDFRINPKGRAKGATNPAFGTDIPTFSYVSDEMIVKDHIIETMCDKACCDRSQCEKDAAAIAATYRNAVQAKRQDYLYHYGWIGSGWEGNTANWFYGALGDGETGNTRNHKKYHYYVEHVAPGPLCHEWQRHVLDTMEEDGSLSTDCFLVWGKSTNVGSGREHSFIEVYLRGKHDEEPFVQLDPWPKARALVK